MLAVVGGLLVILGVYVGAFSPTFRAPTPGLVRRRAEAPTLETPCT